MAKYIYRCKKCGSEWSVVQTFAEAQETTFISCAKCYFQCFRVPQAFFGTDKPKQQEKKVGDLTEEFIAEAKEDLKNQKKETSTEEYKK